MVFKRGVVCVRGSFGRQYEEKEVLKDEWSLIWWSPVSVSSYISTDTAPLFFFFFFPYARANQVSLFHVLTALTSDVLSQVDDLFFAVKDFNTLCVCIVAHTERTRDGCCKSTETPKDGEIGNVLNTK